MTGFIEKFDKIARRLRLLMVVRSSCNLLALIITWAIVFILLDFMFSLPGTLRFLLLLVGESGVEKHRQIVRQKRLWRDPARLLTSHTRVTYTDGG